MLVFVTTLDPCRKYYELPFFLTVAFIITYYNIFAHLQITDMPRENFMVLPIARLSETSTSACVFLTTEDGWWRCDWLVKWKIFCSLVSFWLSISIVVLENTLRKTRTSVCVILSAEDMVLKTLSKPGTSACVFLTT